MKTYDKWMRILAVVLMITAIVITVWQGSRGPYFDNGLVAGVRSGHMRAHHHTQANHFDLLFANRGGVSYNFYGTGVHVYIAYYERDKLVLHELISGISTAEANEVRGSVLWGVTTAGGARRELRVRADIGGAIGSGSFDFSRIDFTHAFSTGGLNTLTDMRIEPGERYVLQVWQTGTTWWADGDIFSPERLRESEKTVILYIVFE